VVWDRVRKQVGWRRGRWKPISELFREEKAEEAILEFVRRTGIGKMSGTSEPSINIQSDEEEREE
jgi:hypothetical protein